MRLRCRQLRYIPSLADLGSRGIGVRDKDSCEFPAEGSVFRLGLDAGRFFAVILRDITERRRHEGTGLGLPLLAKLIELHGVSLTLESARGTGTTAIPRFRGDCLLG